MQVLLLETKKSGKAREAIDVESIERKNMVNHEKPRIGSIMKSILKNKKIEPFFFLNHYQQNTLECFAVVSVHMGQTILQNRWCMIFGADNHLMQEQRMCEKSCKL